VSSFQVSLYAMNGLVEVQVVGNRSAQGLRLFCRLQITILSPVCVCLRVRSGYRPPHPCSRLAAMVGVLIFEAMVGVLI
jgi:hypothetical protein